MQNKSFTQISRSFVSYSIMNECWDDEPSQRPQFSLMASFFKEMLAETSKLYLDMNKFEDHVYVNFDVWKAKSFFLRHLITQFLTIFQK